MTEIKTMFYNACDAVGYQEDSDVDREEWKDIAYVLWALLDDIDTASDMFKPTMNNFYKYAMSKVEERFKQMGSDGHDLFVCKNRPPPE